MAQTTLSAAPGTDVYASPSHGYVFTGHYQFSGLATSSFQCAIVTFSFNWKHTYDQAGLLLAFPTASNPDLAPEHLNTPEGHPRWIKAGIEINGGKPFISVVARETWADWSLSIPPSSVIFGENEVKATIEFVKHKNSLKVFVHDGNNKIMVRQIQWVFDEGAPDVCRIGPYTVRPDPQKDATGDLVVKFTDLVVNAELKA